MLASASRRLLSSCSGVPHHAWARATRGGGSWARSACRRRAAAAGCAAAAVTAAAAAVVLPPSSRAEYRAGDPDLRDVAEHSTQAAFVDTRPVVVAISGAAGQIAYSLLPLVCSGQMFGDGRPVSLRLLDIEPSMTALRGVVMELEDAAYPLLENVYVTSKSEEAFENADAVILLGGFPRRPGMERKDLIEKNTAIFRCMGVALENHARPDAKVLVVANPANTNCLTLMNHAPSIPKANFSALMRLDHNRAKALTARKINMILRGGRGGRRSGVIEDSTRISASDVSNVIIWGNHSSVQFPDLSHAVVTLRSHRPAPVSSILSQEWVEGEFMQEVQQRGAKVMEARKLSSALSAAHAIAAHMRNWVCGTESGKIVSMAVYSDGDKYGVPEGLIFGFPCTCENGEWSIVDDLYLDSRSKSKIQNNVDELVQERATAEALT